jgi:hypothetical protein
MEGINAPAIANMNLSFNALRVDADMMMACVSMRDQKNHTACAVSSDERKF